MTEPIYFYSGSDFYSEFSNFSRHSFVIKDQFFPTVEHYFHYRKHTDAAHRQRILAASTASDAKRLGGSREHPIRSDWDEIKDKVMYRAMKAKFTQDPFLTKLLLSTGDRPLIHYSARDRYWGQTKGGTGKNRMGILLMKLRNVIRKEEQAC